MIKKNYLFHQQVINTGIKNIKYRIKQYRISERESVEIKLTVLYFIIIIQVYAQESKTRERYKDKTRVDIHLNITPRATKTPTIGEQSSSSKKDFVNKYLLTLATALCTLYLLRREHFL